MAAADQAERKLGLVGQPRAVVIHEKKGRRHAHVVWSRIDAESLKAVNLPYFKTALNALSKDLYLEHGWKLSEGYREKGWKNPLNFTLAEWQQAQRIDLDPREIKQVFQQAWIGSDNQQSFKAALEDSGYFLARGDRRGFVAVDIHGEVYSVARMTGVKTKDVTARLGSPDALPSVEDTKAQTQAKLSAGLKEHLKSSREEQRRALKPLEDERAKLVREHRAERLRLERGHAQRWQAESKERAERLRSGLKGVLDFITGRAAQTRAQNGREAVAAYQRDRSQREGLYQVQAADMTALHQRRADLKTQQRQERMKLAAKIGQMLRLTRAMGLDAKKAPDASRPRTPKQRGFDLDL
ncbi:Relaxase/Mobilisation nuclease domain-containing protein [Rhodobacter sp. 24-YEA-8]|nr:Relaxase/Mobilisation nuclease domain-containing protein [Rhodobacter sp. 24-YEA-8]